MQQLWVYPVTEIRIWPQESNKIKYSNEIDTSKRWEKKLPTVIPITGQYLAVLLLIMFLVKEVYSHGCAVKLKKNSVDPKFKTPWEGNKSVRLIVWVCHYHSHFFSLQFAIPQDTPELAAFLYNSTISHYIRRRDVTVAEPHRKNSAKILVSYLKTLNWDYACSIPRWLLVWLQFIYRLLNIFLNYF